jgi:hypothetical protein
MAWAQTEGMKQGEAGNFRRPYSFCTHSADVTDLQEKVMCDMKLQWKAEQSETAGSSGQLLSGDGQKNCLVSALFR